MIARLVLPLSLSFLFSYGTGLVALAAIGGSPATLLPIDKVEPESPTVKGSRYPLRCPVLFLSKKRPHPLTEALRQFVLFPTSQQLITETYIPIKEK